ncbi:hypothetical protein CBR_g31272 [Chara braunii]|uniref:Reverse transcriptase domain-containing protein n=1 Tax=Chara braunii TaxID=69332 RepID=A0A388JXZ0_CHABU|nr:hypothetical protein CBR_g31272 [Chara braunii]|eukprot:GBG62637.1 hypothetical protein CBR_g31272 [Chara braunii]
MATEAELQRGADDWLSTLETGGRWLQAVVRFLSYQLQKGLVNEQGAIMLVDWLEARIQDMLDILWEVEEGPAPQFYAYMDWRGVGARMGVCQALFREGRDLRYQLEDRLAMDDKGVDGELLLGHLGCGFRTACGIDGHLQLAGDSVYTEDVTDYTYTEDVTNPTGTTSTPMVQWVRCPMGICNAPATFQRAMNMMFQNFVNKTRLTQGMINFCVIVYMDDILVYSKTYHGHAQHIEWILGALRDAGFKIALEKSKFFLSEISFLGYVVTRGGLRPDSRKVGAVKEAPVPTSLTQVRAFLGLASYYRRFIKGFVAIARPLTSLLRKDQPLSWDAECQQAFATLKDALATAPILIRPNPSKQFILIMDWQLKAISAILAQKGNDGGEHVIEYASCTVLGERRNDSAPQGECYAVVWGIQHFHPYLYGQKFHLVTNHEPLPALKKLTNYTGMIGRWAVRLQEYDFDIVHRKTERHGNADELTRLHRPAKWSACVEGAAERIPPSQQQYLDPRTIRDPAFFRHPTAEQFAAIREEEEEEESTGSDEDEDGLEEGGDSDEELGEEDETPEEGSYSEHSEWEQSEEEEEDEEGEEEHDEEPAGSKWEAVTEEALRTGT